MINKIAIAGFSGAGKTTLGKRIESELGLSVVHVDKYYFINGRQIRPHNEICDDLSRICSKESWILDGLKFELAEQFLHDADLVIFINPGVIINTKNVVFRKIKHILEPQSKATHESVRKIHFKNTRRIWTDRSGFRKKWFELIERKKDQFEYININKVNKRTSRKVIGKIKEMNGR